MERTRNQNRQADRLLQEIKNDHGIVIIGCDCNSYETSSSYRLLDRGLKNASREVGLTFPFGSLSGARQDVSLNHIDYIWYAGDIGPRRVYKILDGGGSDHLPVLAIFEMN
jgi:endonuclease/exonuclease/phosphatase (EEP) superfamily protein YafD